MTTSAVDQTTARPAKTSARANHASRLITAANRRRRELWAWWRFQPPTFPTVAQLTATIAALSALDSSATAEPDSEAPIFLFSTGMRTGSTLLQRILVTDSRLLLWGEPLAEMAIVPRITQMLCESSGSPFLSTWKLQPGVVSSGLSKSWIALLHPPIGNLRLALRDLFQTWLAQPARRHRFSRWGFKEVRLDAADAALLHWLYPSAKFLLIARHPYDCYRSFADTGWPDSFIRHPDARVNSAASFANHWNRVAVSWSQLPAGFPCRVVKYEDLVVGSFDFRDLESWLGLKIKESEALSASVGATAMPRRLHPYERWIVSRQAAAGMAALGYSR